MAWRAIFLFDLARCSNGAARLGTDSRQVCSHLAPGSTRNSHALSRKPSLAPSIVFQSTLIARSGVCRSARVWARRNRAAPPPRRVPLTGQPARATGMISSWAPTRRRSTTQSRQLGTRCARVCSPSTVEGLGHVGVELGAAAGTSGPSLTPAASPKRLSTRPTRPHDYPTKRCTRVLIFAPPARRLRFEQLQGVGQPTAPVAPLQSTKKGTGKLAARRKWRPFARFGSMTRGSSGGATQIRQARGGIKNFEVMWYMGLKKGPLNGLLWVFRVFFTSRSFTGDVGWLLPLRHGPYKTTQ